VRRAAGGIEHAELPQHRGGGGGVAHGDAADLGQVLLEGGEDAAAHEVADERLGRVVDAATLAPALVGEPEQLPRPHLGVARGRHVPVAPRLVGHVRVGPRQPQGEQALVDVAEVTDGEAGEVDPRAGLLVLAERAEDGRERRVGNARALEHLGAGEARGGEERAVVGGNSPRRVAGAHGAHEQRDAVGQRGGAAVRPLSLHSRGVPHELREGVRPVGLLGDGQVARALGVEEEQGAEDPGERGGLELLAATVVGEVDPLRPRPAPELEPEAGQHALAESQVEATAEPGPEAVGLGEQGPEAPFGEHGGGEEPEQGPIGVGQRGGVDLEVAGDRRARSGRAAKRRSREPETSSP